MDAITVATWITAIAAVIAAFITLTLFIKGTKRRNLNELKHKILTFVKSSSQNREAWVEIIRVSNSANPDPRIKKLINLLGKKYRKDKWCELLPVAIAELGNENHRTLLGLNPNP